MDNNDIKVGVIIPIYNVEKYLKECINSVINQTHKNLSIILVNDGSTDNNSLNIAKEFVKLDDRIVLINKENGGLGNARNVGVNWLLQKYYLKNYIYDDKLYIYETKNQDEHNIKQIFYKNNKLKYENVDYLIFLDSDDYIKLNTIEECVKVANNNDIVWFDFEFLYDGIETQNKKTHHELYNINKSYKITANEWLDLLQDNNKNMFWFGRHGMVSLEYIKNIKLEFINNIIHEDHYYGKMLYVQSNNIYILNQKLYIYRIRPNSIMAYNENIDVSNLSKSVAYLYNIFNNNILTAKQYYKDSSLAITAIEVHKGIDKLNIDENIKHKFIKIFYKPLIKWANEINNYQIDPLSIKDKVFEVLPHMEKLYNEVNKTYNKTINNTKKQISVIIPIYNIQEFLPECIDSILNQTYPYFNLILINDGSMDDTLNIAKHYAYKDNRIIVVDKNNEGQSKSRNLGLDLLYEAKKVKKISDKYFKVLNKSAIKNIYTNENNITNEYLNIKTDYIMFIDGDDTIENNCFKECIDNIGNCEIIWFNFKMFADKNYHGELPNWNRMKRFNITQNQTISSINFAKLMIDNKICQFAFMVDGMIDFKLMQAIKLKFPTNGYAEDHYFGLVLFLESNNIQIYNKIFYNYRVRNGSSCNFNNQAIKISEHIKQYYHFLFKDKALAKDYYNFSGYCDTTYKLVQFFQQRKQYKELAKIMLPYYINQTILLMKFFKYKNEDIEKLIFINNYLKNIFNINKTIELKIRLHLSYRLGVYLYWLNNHKLSFIFIPKYLTSIYRNYKRQKKYFLNLKTLNIIPNNKLPKQYVLGNKIITKIKKIFLFKL